MRVIRDAVVPWTVNQAVDMACLIDWGVDGLITDYPDLLREVMAQRPMRGCRRDSLVLALRHGDANTDDFLGHP
jgi:hypothetical protein